MVHALCPPSERIATLDVLQGLVLLGLLIAQAFGPPGSSQPDHLLPLDHHPAELPVQFLVQLLVAGQFERMGSFVFGLGLYQCWQYVGLGSTSLVIVYANRMVRRLLIGLLGIGLVLSLLLGSVDLLAQYALLGFTLLYFMNQSVSSLLYWMMGVAGLAIGVPSCLGPLHSVELIRLVQAFSCNLSYELMMLSGVLVGKLGLSQQDAQLRVRLSLLQVVLLPTAFLLKGAWVVMALGLLELPQRVVAHQPLLLALSGFFGPLLLTGVYLLDVGVNTRLRAMGWTRWVGRVGQLSVSNYVFQSLLCTILLYGFGVVVSSPLSFLGRAGIVVGIFAFQLTLSKVWLRYYGHGPIEWVCRQWIYGKRAPSNAVSTTSH